MAALAEAELAFQEMVRAEIQHGLIGRGYRLLQDGPFRAQVEGPYYLRQDLDRPVRNIIRVALAWDRARMDNAGSKGLAVEFFEGIERDHPAVLGVPALRPAPEPHRVHLYWRYESWPVPVG